MFKVAFFVRVNNSKLTENRKCLIQPSSRCFQQQTHLSGNFQNIFWTFIHKLLNFSSGLLSFFVGWVLGGVVSASAPVVVLPVVTLHTEWVLVAVVNSAPPQCFQMLWQY